MMTNICINRVYLGVRVTQTRMLTESTASLHAKPSKIPKFIAMSVRETSIPVYRGK